MQYYLGVDVGSVSTNFVLIDEKQAIKETIYLRTKGRPLETIKDGLINIFSSSSNLTNVRGIGTTGSGRQLAAAVIGADVVKNEITAHAVAAVNQLKDVRTILEIGGQDSKIIVLHHGVVSDFAMNTVCAAGTGSFLDQQAARMGLKIHEFAELALKAKSPVRIAGRCSVFAESDMIHKQQLGHTMPDIVAGLCEALVRNYLNNVGKGKEIKPPVIFQGGVAANPGIRTAFEKALGCEIIVPECFNVMGALGAAILAKEKMEKEDICSHFKGINLISSEFATSSFECQDCPNRCEIIQLMENDALIARWGDRCNKWTDAIENFA